MMPVREDRGREGMETTPRFQTRLKWTHRDRICPCPHLLRHPEGSQPCSQNSPTWPQSPARWDFAVQSWCHRVVLFVSHCTSSHRASPRRPSCTSHTATPLCLLKCTLSFKFSSSARSAPPHSAGVSPSSTLPAPGTALVARAAAGSLQADLLCLCSPPGRWTQ